MEYSAWKIKCRDCGKSSLRSEPSPCPKCYSKNIEVTKALSVMERISLAANFIPLIALITVCAIRMMPSFNAISQALSTIKYFTASFKL